IFAFDSIDEIPNEEILFSGFLVYTDKYLLRGNYINYNVLYRKIDDLNYELSIDEIYEEKEDTNTDRMINYTN
ncbi:hypothetical protein LJC58_09700, partial [Lachnospiraceae bacterium OttesenSCG-928-D06]|nr:hypothetical protein [Lachnospiraceae bacterium OttesenSCG-928-D06]